MHFARETNFSAILACAAIRPRFYQKFKLGGAATSTFNILRMTLELVGWNG